MIIHRVGATWKRRRRRRRLSIRFAKRKIWKYEITTYYGSPLLPHLTPTHFQQQLHWYGSHFVWTHARAWRTALHQLARYESNLAIILSTRLRLGRSWSDRNIHCVCPSSMSTLFDCLPVGDGAAFIFNLNIVFFCCPVFCFRKNNHFSSSIPDSIFSWVRWQSLPSRRHVATIANAIAVITLLHSFIIHSAQ